LNDKYERDDSFLSILGIKSVPGLSQQELIEKLDPEYQRYIEQGKKYGDLSADEQMKLDKLADLLRSQRNKTKSHAPIEIKNTQQEIDKENPFVITRRPEENKIKPNPDIDGTTEEPKVSTEELILQKINYDEKYSKNWFKDMLQYESILHGEKESGNTGLTIRFSDFAVDNVGHSLCLSNPNRSIPSSIECMDNIVVLFNFTDGEPVSMAFDAASVKEYSITLKYRKSEENDINNIAVKRKCFTNAVLKSEKSIALISELKRSFEELKLPYEDSLENHLPKNLKFIFGPPGTGKTTVLVKDYIYHMSIYPKKEKVLFLAPTNKACDVILRKAIDMIDERSKPERWLGRFAQTMDESLSDYVVSGGFKLPDDSKYCLISTMARFPYDGFLSSSLNSVPWDKIIIDEASMIPLAYIIYAVFRYPKTEFIIAGDPFQIEPIVQAHQWKGENIYTFVGLNNYLSDTTPLNDYPVNRLSKQYRSVSAIGDLFGKYRYNGKIEHFRGMQRARKLKIEGMDIKTNNFIYFRSVEDGDSIFQPHKIQSSSIQVYSILLVYEFLQYLVRNIVKNENGRWKIGVICPYRAEADVIQKLWSQHIAGDAADVADVQIGTVHGFQGDECDVIIAVYNPPAGGLTQRATDTFINNKNIMNVAVSRASDYFFLFYPDKNTPNFEKMYEINEIGKIALSDKGNYCGISAEELEEIMLKDKHYIERNSFVTFHQMSNIYTQPIKKYEVRIDENAVDIITTDEL